LWGKKKANKHHVTAKSTFTNVTQCDPKVAELVLKKFGYNLQTALNHYWSHRADYPANPSKEPSQANVKQLDTLFDAYADLQEEKDSTSEDGLMKFYGHVDIDPAHRYAFYVAYILKSESSGVISRKEFVQGFGKMGLFKIADIKTKLKTECANIDRSKEQFNSFYLWLFAYLKETAQKKSIPRDIAAVVWELVLGSRGLKLLSDFIEYVQNSDDVKGITSDTWINVKKFLEECDDAKSFENDGAWPILIDGYLDDRGEA